MAERQVALLRGINVTGCHMVPMARLAAIFTELGCADVRTYINSGNVVYTPGRKRLTEAGIAAVLEQEFGFAIPVVVRNAAEVQAISTSNPFVAAGADPKALHTVFLQQAMPVGSAELLSAAAAPGEEFAVGTSVLYLHLPGGVARSKLALVPGKAKFGVVGTMRNWATTLKLAEMVR